MAPLTAADNGTCYDLAHNAWFCAQYWTDRSTELRHSTDQHIELVVYSIVLSLLISFPLALIARRYRVTEPAILGLSTIVYTIPSLAMYSLLLPIWDISKTTVVVGLALYAITILVRGILAGLDAVPDDAIEAAKGMGYGPTRMLFRIELPLALPTIMAGLRVATVSTVALATVGAILNYGGLGNLLYQAVDTQFKAQITAASVLCVGLAVVFDVLLLGLGWLLTPWRRSQSRLGSLLTSRRGSRA
jgi:osmoprotectant transport system permease protein